MKTTLNRFVKSSSEPKVAVRIVRSSWSENATCSSCTFVDPARILLTCGRIIVNHVGVTGHLFATFIP